MYSCFPLLVTTDPASLYLIMSIFGDFNLHEEKLPWFWQHLHVKRSYKCSYQTKYLPNNFRNKKRIKPFHIDDMNSSSSTPLALLVNRYEINVNAQHYWLTTCVVIIVVGSLRGQLPPPSPPGMIYSSLLNLLPTDHLHPPERKDLGVTCQIWGNKVNKWNSHVQTPSKKLSEWRGADLVTYAGTQYPGPGTGLRSYYCQFNWLSR